MNLIKMFYLCHVVIVMLPTSTSCSNIAGFVNETTSLDT